MDIDKLKEIFSYSEETGLMRWVNDNGWKNKAGDILKNKNQKGYIVVPYDGKTLYVHKLAFAFVHGYMPKQCDHINRDKTDNRIVNLREATGSQNNLNTVISTNRSGYRGVSWSKRRQKWNARLGSGGKNIHIGWYKCKHQAFCEYVLKAREVYGDFSRY